MAKLHGRFGPWREPRDRTSGVKDPGADTVNTTPGLKITRRGPGIERVEPRARTPERFDLRALAEARAAARAAQKEVAKAAMQVAVAARVAARAIAAEKAGPPRHGFPSNENTPPVGRPAWERDQETVSGFVPDVAHLKGENAIPAKIESHVVEVKPLSPEQEAEVQAVRRGLRVREALRSQDPKADKTVNTGLHVVKTPGGVAKYHRERQGAALEMARGMKGKDRKFALEMAREHAEAKRAAGGGGKSGAGDGGGGQPRVPAGQPDGGQWTKG